MGNLLDTPITEKDGESKEIHALKIGIAGMQGWRVEMEDAHAAEALNDDHCLVAVFDGHGGQYAAIFSAENIASKLKSMEDWHRYMEDQSNIELLGEAFRKTYVALDEELREKDEVERSGCTAISAIITPTHIVVANAGDSRCVLGTNNETKPLSQDHKPYLDSEKRRIENAGGKVSWKRVDGDLAVSRALGDFYYKNRRDLPPEDQKVTACPEIQVHQRTPEDELLFLACDGVWDVMSNEEAIDTSRAILMEGETDIRLVVEEIIDICLDKGSRDNISGCIVAFPGAKYGEGGGVHARRLARKAKQEEARKAQLGGELPEDEPEAGSA